MKLNLCLSCYPEGSAHWLANLADFDMLSGSEVIRAGEWVCYWQAETADSEWNLNLSPYAWGAGQQNLTNVLTDITDEYICSMLDL